MEVVKAKLDTVEANLSEFKRVGIEIFIGDDDAISARRKGVKLISLADSVLADMEAIARALDDEEVVLHTATAFLALFLKLRTFSGNICRCCYHMLGVWGNPELGFDMAAYFGNRDELMHVTNRFHPFQQWLNNEEAELILGLARCIEENLRE